MRPPQIRHFSVAQKKDSKGVEALFEAHKAEQIQMKKIGPEYWNWYFSKENYKARMDRADKMAKRRSASAIAVTKAVKLWILPPASYWICCDCDKRAECYDHRNYNKPMDVWPVCSSCDATRGAAWPYDGSDIYWETRRKATKKRIAAMVRAEKEYKRSMNSLQ